ncbi:protein-O-fucosyltransferase-like protein [Selaginella moellendorffii]|uniref:Protein-O-fucosyltransferase-like protein n=1 Tax=Selaginella moellendorffii TaxID=88036 RepID=D8REK8_SELML|nr:protein-O-fucosyltransferase-like protein [Selaginella moellendorffii]
MFFAALLDRTLVFPDPCVDYSYEKTLDIAHICSCLGEKTLLTLHEFLGKNKTDIRLLCYMSGCFLDEDHEKKIKALGLPRPMPGLKKLLSKAIHLVLARANSWRRDVFYSDVESELVAQIGGPFQHSCKTIIRPNRPILLTAQSNLHLEEDPGGQALSDLHLAVESEITLLQQLLGPDVPMIQRPQHDSREKWDAILQRKGLLADNQVVAMLDKTICAMAQSFIGTRGSQVLICVGYEIWMLSLA